MARDPIDDWIDKAIEPVLKAIEAEMNDDEFDKPSGGPPLSPEEIDTAKKNLTQWQSPDAFKAASDTLLARYIYNDRRDLFVKPQLEFLRDAFVLARFACRQGG